MYSRPLTWISKGNFMDFDKSVTHSFTACLAFSISLELRSTKVQMVKWSLSEFWKITSLIPDWRNVAFRTFSLKFLKLSLIPWLVRGIVTKCVNGSLHRFSATSNSILLLADSTLLLLFALTMTSPSLPLGGIVIVAPVSFSNCFFVVPFTPIMYLKKPDGTGMDAWYLENIIKIFVQRNYRTNMGAKEMHMIFKKHAVTKNCFLD